MIFIHLNWYSKLYNTNLKSLKTKKMNLQTNSDKHVNNIKQHSTYATNMTIFESLEPKALVESALDQC